MINSEAIAYSIASFVCALFVLEFGADKFIDHTAIVAERTGIPEAVIGLLTAGAEWEELAVVVASIARGRSSLAIGNVVGSAISNILGAFSLGLIFYSGEERIVFDKSSRVYTLLLLLITVLVAVIVGLGGHDGWRIFGVIAIALFVVYVASVAWAIMKRSMTAPEMSDSDSDSGSDSENSSDTDSITADQPDNILEHADDPTETTALITSGETPAATASMSNAGVPHTANTRGQYLVSDVEAAQHGSSILNSSASRPRPPSAFAHNKYKHGMLFHISFLILGFLAIVLSSYVLSHAASTIVDELGVSDVLFGVVILSIATTLPEKLVAVVSAHRGHGGILVANTVGSNIFLLTLCTGVLWISTGGVFDGGSVNAVELAVMVGSTIAMTLTVWCNVQWSRWSGGLMLVCYIAFLVLEFTVIRKV